MIKFEKKRLKDLFKNKNLVFKKTDISNKKKLVIYSNLINEYVFHFV